MTVESIPLRSVCPSAPADLLTWSFSDFNVNPGLWLSVFCAKYEEWCKFCSLLAGSVLLHCEHKEVQVRFVLSLCV